MINWCYAIQICLLVNCIFTGTILSQECHALISYGYLKHINIKVYNKKSVVLQGQSDRGNALFTHTSTHYRRKIFVISLAKFLHTSIEKKLSYNTLKWGTLPVNFPKYISVLNIIKYRQIYFYFMNMI